MLSGIHQEGTADHFIAKFMASEIRWES